MDGIDTYLKKLSALEKAIQGHKKIVGDKQYDTMEWHMACEFSFNEMAKQFTELHIEKHENVPNVDVETFITTVENEINN